MEEKIKCSLEEHKQINAIKYCSDCKIYMCNKCDNYHSSPLFKNHNSYNISNSEETFTGICQEKDHFNKLEYFCKSHNILCCVKCLCKLNEKGEGQHKDCDVCYLEKIKEEKKNKLKENIIYLENLQNTLNESLEIIKKIFENIEKDKDTIKLEIQNIFTKLRNFLNNREDELLLLVDNIFNINYFSEDMIKKGEKLPTQIKKSLENGKLIDKEWNNNNLNYCINNCINIENNIKNINIINEKINNFNKNKKIKLIFYPKINELDKFKEKINSFGKLYYYSDYLSENTLLNIKENSSLINISQKLLCDYPFQDDKINHAKLEPNFSFGIDKTSLTQFKNLKCINTNGLLAVKKDIDLNRDWILFFEFCKKDWSPVDWSHIFSFGVHINYGGKDDSYYPITLETKPRDGTQIMILTSKNAGDGNWHKITVKYEKDSKLLEGFVDNNLIESKIVSLNTTNGFYFGGQGWCGEFSMYLRNFKFLLDLNLKFTDFISIIN